MELKTKYQYTYFIYPFVVKENKYQKYLLKLLKDERFNLKKFEKQKDIKMYQYFSPKLGQLLFSGFSTSNKNETKQNDLPIETISAILAKNPCTIFEYNLKRDVQGKTEEAGIFFKIRKIELICFKNGICFLTMKTNIEDSNLFSDVLNFNYKFRDIQQSKDMLNSYDKIHIQTDTFEDMNKLTEFIEEITGSKFESLKLDIDTERFLTYSYVCIDQQSWGEQKKFQDIEYQFIKFSNFLPADNIVSYENKKSISFTQWKYARMGVSKQGITLFTSDAEMNNYTILPDEFENQYLYTYILNLYKMLSLKKLSANFQKSEQVKKVRKQFIEFTKKVWIQDITNDEIGAYFNYNISKVLRLDRLYNEVKNQFDVIYKEFNIEKNHKILKYILISMLILIIFTVLNYIELIK